MSSCPTASWIHFFRQMWRIIPWSNAAKCLWTVCCLLAILFWSQSWTPARGIVEQSGALQNKNAQAAEVTDFAGPRGGTDPKCGCRLEVLRLIAAAADARDVPQQSEVPQNP